jgi:tRNA 5-methylaminomethyl-2-thiouridine biosynthesis bifunctional protein
VTHAPSPSPCALDSWPPQGPPDWHVLACGFGLGHHFFDTWLAWRHATRAPERLHYTAIEPLVPSTQALLAGARNHPAWAPLAQQLTAQWWGLLPGARTVLNWKTGGCD